MRRNTRFAVLMSVLWGLAGCASAPETGAPAEGRKTEERKLSLRAGEALEGPACGLESPECPDGLTCASLDLDTGRRFLCVRHQDVCERLQCSQGKCVILESYPAQIRCGA